MIQRLMPSCGEVARSVSTGEFETASLPRKLLFKTHLMMCAFCRSYARQLALMARGLKERSRACRPDPERLLAIKQRLVKHLALS